MNGIIVENLLLFNTIAESLKAKNYSDVDIQKFKEKWLNVTATEPLPCPICYLANNSISRLRALNEANKKEPVKCTVCGVTFYPPVV